MRILRLSLKWPNHSSKKRDVDRQAEKLVELYKPQMKSVDEIVPLTDLFFSDFPELTEAEREVMAGEAVPTVLEAFKAKLEAMSDDEFVVENIFPQIKAVQKETGIKGKNLFMPIRIAVSGEMHGPELPDTIYLLGREKSIQHIEKNVGRKLQNSIQKELKY